MYLKVESPSDASNLSNLLKDGNWMVLYYAEWCGHCKTMKPEWQKVVNKMSKSNTVNVAEVESEHIGDLVHKPKVDGFPSIKMYNKGSEVSNFEDERVADKIEKFANDNAKSNSNSKIANKEVINLVRPPALPYHLKHQKPKLPKLPILQQIPILPKPVIKSRKPKTPKYIFEFNNKITKPKIQKPKNTPFIKRKPLTKRAPIKKAPSSNKNPNNVRKTTKNVFEQLIKSFTRIGHEAEKDTKLLKKATSHLS
uniref:Thioredoxin domain-containing protein n=1 Tax=viral metagenome TaxID=1070528 RepID=A0A6C0F196_9ZZZZ